MSLGVRSATDGIREKASSISFLTLPLPSEILEGTLRRSQGVSATSSTAAEEDLVPSSVSPSPCSGGMSFLGLPRPALAGRRDASPALGGGVFWPFALSSWVSGGAGSGVPGGYRGSPFTPWKFAPEMSAPRKSAPVIFAPRKTAPVRSASKNLLPLS